MVARGNNSNLDGERRNTTSTSMMRNVNSRSKTPITRNAGRLVVEGCRKQPTLPASTTTTTATATSMLSSLFSDDLFPSLGVVSSSSSSNNNRKNATSNLSLKELASKLRETLATKEERQQLVATASASAVPSSKTAPLPIPRPASSFTARHNAVESSRSSSKAVAATTTNKTNTTTSTTTKTSTEMKPSNYLERVQAADEALHLLRAQLKTKPTATSKKSRTSSSKDNAKKKAGALSSSSSSYSSKEEEQRDDKDWDVKESQAREAAAREGVKLPGDRSSTKAFTTTRKSRDKTKHPSSSSSSSSSSSKEDQRDDMDGVEVELAPREEALREGDKRQDSGSSTKDPTTTTTTTPSSSSTSTSSGNSRNKRKEQELRLKAEAKIAKLYVKIGDMDHKLATAEEHARNERKLTVASEQKVASLEKAEKRLTTQLDQARHAKSLAEERLLKMMDKMSDMDHNLSSTEEKLALALNRHEQEVHQKNVQVREVKELRGQLKAVEKKLSSTKKGLTMVRAEQDNSTKCIAMLQQMVEEKEEALMATAQQLRDKDEKYRTQMSRLKKTDQQISALEQRLDNKRSELQMFREEQRTQQTSLVTNSVQNKYLLSSLEKAKEQCRTECTKRLALEKDLRDLRAANANNHPQEDGITCKKTFQSGSSKSKASLALYQSICSNKTVQPKSMTSSNRRSNLDLSIGTASVESWTSKSYASTIDRPTTFEESQTHRASNLYTDDGIPYIDRSPSAVFSEMESIFSSSSPRHQWSLRSPRHEENKIQSKKSSVLATPAKETTMETESVRERKQLLSKDKTCSKGRRMEQGGARSSSETTAETEPISCYSNKNSRQGNKIDQSPEYQTEMKPLVKSHLRGGTSDVVSESEDPVQETVSAKSETESRIEKESASKKASDISPVPGEAQQMQPVKKYSAQQEKDLLASLPMHVKDMFQKVGFYKDRKMNHYLPVLCLAPYSMPPGPAQETVLGKPSEFVGIFIYGQRSDMSTYQAIKWFRMIPYETGIEMGLLKLPELIAIKIERRVPLLASEDEYCRGLEQIRKEATKSASERTHSCAQSQQPSDDDTGSPLPRSESRTSAPVVAKAPPVASAALHKVPKADALSLESRESSKAKKMRIARNNSNRGNLTTVVKQPAGNKAGEEATPTERAGKVADTVQQCMTPEWHLPQLEGEMLHKPIANEVQEVAATKNEEFERSAAGESHPLTSYQGSFTKTHEKFSAAEHNFGAKKKKTVTSGKPPKPEAAAAAKRARVRGIPQFILTATDSGTDCVSEMGDGGVIAPNKDAKLVQLLKQILGDEYSDNLDSLQWEQMNRCQEIRDSSCFTPCPSDEAGSKQASCFFS